VLTIQQDDAVRLGSNFFNTNLDTRILKERCCIATCKRAIVTFLGVRTYAPLRFAGLADGCKLNILDFCVTIINFFPSPYFMQGSALTGT